MSSIENKAIRTVILSEFLDFLAFAILIPVVPPLIINSDIGIFADGTSEAHKNIVYGFLIATFSIAQFFSAPLFGMLSDKYGRRKILSFALLFTLSGYIVSATGVFTGQLWLLFMGRILCGIGFGNQPILFSAIADISSPENKAKNYGMIGIAFGLSFILGPATGGIISTKFALFDNKYLLPFLLSITFTLLNILLVVTTFPETNQIKRERKFSFFSGFQNISEALKNPKFNILFLIVLTTGFGFNFFREFIQLYLLGKFNFQPNDLGKYFSFIGITAAVTQGGLLRIISKKFSPEKVITIALPLLAFCLLMLIFPTEVWQLFAITFFLSMSQSLIFPNVTALISNKATQENQGEILGINQSVNSVAQAIPPIIGGFVISIQLSIPLIIASTLTITGWAIFIFYRYKIGKK